jgi:hypothetical protein
MLISDCLTFGQISAQPCLAANHTTEVLHPAPVRTARAQEVWPAVDTSVQAANHATEVLHLTPVRTARAQKVGPAVDTSVLSGA